MLPGLHPEADGDAATLRLPRAPEGEEVERLGQAAGTGAEGIGAARRGDQPGIGGDRVGAGERPVPYRDARGQREQGEIVGRAMHHCGGVQKGPWIQRPGRVRPDWRGAGRREGIPGEEDRAAGGPCRRQRGLRCSGTPEVAGVEHQRRFPTREAERRRARIGQAGRTAEPRGGEPGHRLLRPCAVRVRIRAGLGQGGSDGIGMLGDDQRDGRLPPAEAGRAPGAWGKAQQPRRARRGRGLRGQGERYGSALRRADDVVGPEGGQVRLARQELHRQVQGRGGPAAGGRSGRDPGGAGFDHHGFRHRPGTAWAGRAP